MYLCKLCGNRKYFIEHNCVETEVTIDEFTGEPTGSHDTFVSCSEVVCGICNATSKDENILDRFSMKPIERNI